MRIRTRWPWIMALVSVVLFANPLGIEVIHSAFFSAEALSRGIWGPIVLVAFVGCALLILLETVVRAVIWRRGGGNPATF